MQVQRRRPAPQQIEKRGEGKERGVRWRAEREGDMIDCVIDICIVPPTGRSMDCLGDSNGRREEKYGVLAINIGIGGHDRLGG
jgi:hypothetical protein